MAYQRDQPTGDDAAARDIEELQSALEDVTDSLQGATDSLEDIAEILYPGQTNTLIERYRSHVANARKLLE